MKFVQLNLRHLVGSLALKVSEIVHPFRMKHVSWGNDLSDKRFLVIRRRGYGSGLFSYFYTNLAWIAWAERNGYVPVIDMQHHRTVYHAKGEALRANAWELFFNQPAGYSLSDIRTAKNVTIVDALAMPGEKDFLPSIGSTENVENCPSLSMWREIAARTITVRDHVLDDFVSEEFECALPNGIVGVLARGTDYVRLKPSGHPVQPTTEQLIKAVRSYLSDKHADLRVYLVTEDELIARAFQCEFGDRLLLSKQRFATYSGGYLGKNATVAGDVARGCGYLKAIVDLARCPALIAGRTSGTIGAVVLSRGFSFSKVFNLGVYP